MERFPAETGVGDGEGQEAECTQQRAPAQSPSPPAGLGRLLPAMNHTFDSSQDLGQLLGSGLSPHSPFCLNSEKAIAHWGQHWNDKTPEHCSGEMEAVCVLLVGEPFLSNTQPVVSLQRSFILGHRPGGRVYCSAGGYYHIPGDSPVRSGISLLWTVL